MITVRVPESLREKLKQMAWESRVTLNELCEASLRRTLSGRKRKDRPVPVALFNASRFDEELMDGDQR